jgi:molybdopterin-guanine dinucleotide biosynthesis protein A
MNAPFAAALFAGGRSTRFGSDKAFYRLEDQPLWQRQIDKLEPLMPSEILISANADQHFDTPHRTLVDAAPDSGPLGALVTCLRATKLPRLLVLAVDLPEMTLNFLGELAYAGCGAVPQDTEGRFEPLAAVYPAEMLPLAEAQLASGDLRMQHLITSAVREGFLQPRTIADSESTLFTNLNAPPPLPTS